MNWKRILPQDSAIMFDVGFSGVRAAQMSRRGGRHVVSDCLSLDTTTADEPDAAPTLDCDRMARMVEQGCFRGREVGVVLSPPDVHVHALAVPEAVLDRAPARVEEALTFEMTRETRLDAADLELRHWRLPRGHREGVNVMSVAVARSAIMRLADQLDTRGLSLRRVDLAPCALARLAMEARPPAPDTAWGVIDLGARRSMLTMLIGRTPVYVRSIPIGGVHWTRRIAEAFEVPLREAESIKRAYGMSPTQAPRSLEETGDAHLPALVFGLLNESVQALIRAVNLCFTYVLENYANHIASRLVVGGRGADTPGLCDLLGEFLDIPVERLTPNLGESRAALATACGTAVGAALSDLESDA